LPFVCFLEHGAKRPAAVVIAHHQYGRDAQACQAPFELLVGALLAPMREIARHDHEGEAVVLAIDCLDRCRKPRSGIERIQTTAGRNEVRVGQDNKLH
jgi:hypothetical protein